MTAPELTVEDAEVFRQHPGGWGGSCRAVISHMLADGRLCLPPPAEPPEGYERVRIALWYEPPSDGLPGWWDCQLAHEAKIEPEDVIITADVPVPRPVEVMGTLA